MVVPLKELRKMSHMAGAPNKNDLFRSMAFGTVVCVFDNTCLVNWPISCAPTRNAWQLFFVVSFCKYVMF